MNSLLQEAQRIAMIMDFCAEKSNQEISDFNNIPIDTVKNFKHVWDKFLKEEGNPDEFDNKIKVDKRRSDAHGEDIVDMTIQEASLGTLPVS